MSETENKQQSMLAGSMSAVMSVIGVGVILAAAYGLRHGTLGEIIWFATSLAMTIIRMPHSRRNQSNQIVDDKKDTIEKALLLLMFLSMAVLPYLELATRVFSFASYTLPGWAVWIGIGVQAPFLWLFWRSHVDLGKNWSPGLEIRDAHGLVSNGVYARMRHPMYAALWLSVLAQPLLIQNWIAGALVIPAWMALYVTRIPKEEAMMRGTFGEAYDAYVARTGRIWPKFS